MMAKFGSYHMRMSFEVGRLLVNHGSQFCVGAPRLPRTSHFWNKFICSLCGNSRSLRKFLQQSSQKQGVFTARYHFGSCGVLGGPAIGGFSHLSHSAIFQKIASNPEVNFAP